LKNYLSSVKVNGNKTDNIFELLNFEYLGPVDGHEISSLLTVFDKAKKIKGPKLVHIITKKGKGLKLADIHDVAIQKLPVIFCIDRAGLVGNDGATHHGVFDISYLRCIPNLIISAPRNEIELRNILYTSQLKNRGPIAIRYPRGRGLILDWKKKYEEVKIGQGEQIRSGKLLSILCVGTVINEVIDISNKLDLSLYDMRFIKPIDTKILHKVCQRGDKIITIEDGVKAGGFGSSILEFMSENNYLNKVKVLGVPDVFVKHGDTKKLKESIGLDKTSLEKTISNF